RAPRRGGGAARRARRGVGLPAVGAADREVRLAPRAGAATSRAGDCRPAFAPDNPAGLLPLPVRAILRLFLADDFPPAAFTLAFLAPVFLLPAFAASVFLAAG